MLERERILHGESEQDLEVEAQSQLPAVKTQITREASVVSTFTSANIRRPGRHDMEPKRAEGNDKSAEPEFATGLCGVL